MNGLYEFKNGQVKRYTKEKRDFKNPIRAYYIIYCILALCAVVSTLLIFERCIVDKNVLSDTIALGSIFATFGSSLVAIFSLIMGSYYDHFLLNMKILYEELEPNNGWKRWPFIKRYSHKRLFNREQSYQVLENSTITFDVGSHQITVELPTIKEDFFDLPNWKYWKLMKDNEKNFESTVYKKGGDIPKALMVWDCIYDNYSSVLHYRIARMFVVIGEEYIFSSIIWAFCYRLL